MSQAAADTIEVKFGYTILEPIRYRVVEEVTGPWWWRRREFWIDSNYCRIGPFRTEAEANRMLAFGLAGTRGIRA